MSLPKLASVAAHQFLTQLIDLEAIPPSAEVVAVARSQEHRLRIVVSITRDDGPAVIDPSVIEKIAALSASQAPSKCPIKLTPLMQAIVEQLQPDKPTKAEVVAMRLGKKCGGSFRTMLADLVRFGVIRHVPRVGYFRVIPDVGEPS